MTTTSARLRARRADLMRRVARPVLLMGTGTRARNLPMNHVPFRQDSTFLYYIGAAIPDVAALITERGTTLYIAPQHPDDPLWHGDMERHEAVAARLGIDHVAPPEQLAADVASRAPATLAIADHIVNQQASALTGADLVFGQRHGDSDLVQAVIEMRRTKSDEEIDAMREAATVSAYAHTMCMRATVAGRSERSLAALFRATLNARGFALGYDTILTQRGEVLHNHAHDGVLTHGNMVLLDGGGEHAHGPFAGLGADITRTWPVSGTFTGRQRAAYDAVLESQRVSIAACRPGVRYREVHDAGCRVLAQFMLDEGLLSNISVDDAVTRGAHALVFPHGMGHLLGMDVHDLENFGDLPAYPPGQGRPEPFGTRYLRLDLPLEPGWVVTVEPGFYIVPAILRNTELLHRFKDCFDVTALHPWQGFGGIRIEDDGLVTDGAPDVLSTAVPKDPDTMCELVGTGATLEDLLP